MKYVLRPCLLTLVNEGHYRSTCGKNGSDLEINVETWGWEVFIKI